MPAKFFVCPNGEKVFIDICLHKCLQNLPTGRCLPARTLRLIAEQRPWEGKPSTTQLLKGTREAYLEITRDYALNPQNELFRILGTRAHTGLDHYTGDNELGEIRLSDENASGQFDFYDAENQILYDSKTWGSYKVMMALGLRQETIETEEVYKTGPKKGQKKTKKVIVQGEPDMLETEIQLNHYRMMLEDAGFPVREMYVEAIVRDGGTHIAKGRGIEQNGYLIPVRRLNNDFVNEYLKTKADALLNALKNNIMPPPCNDDETWNGRKCKEFCRVWEFCDVGIKARINEEEEREGES